MSDKVEREFFLDKCGRKVIVGDYILYGYNLGRCASVKFGRVIKIGYTAKTNSYDSPWSISVRGIEWEGDPNNTKDGGYRRPSISGRGTLNYPARMVNANDFIPKDLKDLLDESMKTKE